MTKNLETADNIVKLVLASATIVLFYTRIIAGPFAVVLVVLSFIVLLIYGIRLVYKGLFIDRKH